MKKPIQYPTGTSLTLDEYEELLPLVEKKDRGVVVNTSLFITTAVEKSWVQERG
jgi:hypothetical protein